MRAYTAPEALYSMRKVVLEVKGEPALRSLAAALEGARLPPSPRPAPLPRAAPPARARRSHPPTSFPPKPSPKLQSQRRAWRTSCGWNSRRGLPPAWPPNPRPSRRSRRTSKSCRSARRRWAARRRVRRGAAVCVTLFSVRRLQGGTPDSETLKTGKTDNLNQKH